MSLHLTGTPPMADTLDHPSCIVGHSGLPPLTVTCTCSAIGRDAAPAKHQRGSASRVDADVVARSEERSVDHEKSSLHPPNTWMTAHEQPGQSDQQQQSEIMDVL